MLEEMEQYSTVCGGMAITKQEKEGRKYQVSKKKKDVSNGYTNQIREMLIGD